MQQLENQSNPFLTTAAPSRKTQQQQDCTQHAVMLR